MLECNREHMTMWIEALESGEFRQTASAMRVKYGNEYRYCCLGVATQVALRNGMEFDRETLDLASAQLEEPESNLWRVYDGYLSPEVQEWLGVSHQDPLVTPVDTAAHANDELSWTFPAIAAALRQTYLGEPGA